MNRRAEFLDALQGREPSPKDIREHLNLYLRRTTQYQKAGLYYQWGLDYNRALKYQDLETEFIKLTGGNHV